MPSQLLRLDPKAKSVVRSSTPNDFDNLLSVLSSNSADLRQAFHAWEAPAREERSPQNGENGATHRSAGSKLSSYALAGWQFAPQIPAIVHPLLHHRDPFDDTSPVTGPAVDWLVVVLDSATLEQRILPELTSRYFGDPKHSEYNVAVLVNSSRPEAIYSSDADFDITDRDEFDSVMNIFGWTTDDSKLSPKENGSPGRRGEQWRNFAASVWFPVIQDSPDVQPWLLALQHRSSPVESIANQVWRRDLVIGTVVLVLLATSMGFVALTGARAQKFAKVQMEFVASVSHELRTPLAAIHSASENIRDGFVHGKENLRFYGSLLTGQSKELADLVDRILLFASTQDGKSRFATKPLMISEILMAVKKNTAELVEGGGYRIEENIAPDLPAAVGDHSGVCACLQNLISNAVKYGGSDRWIGLTATCHTVDRKFKEIRISVADHGQGLSSSELSHIFEPFYRSPRVVTAQIHGTGLGLALAKEIAEAIGGRISVTSRPGVGSTFTLHLRAAEEGKREPESAITGVNTVPKR
jgi:signal transduction histidine kinase